MMMKTKRIFALFPRPDLVGISFHKTIGKAFPLSCEHGLKQVVDKDTGQSSLKLVWRQPVQRDIAKYITWNTLSVPTEPTEEIAKVRSKIPRQRLQELQQLFDREPIWTRSYVVNSVSADTSRYLKKLLPCFGYVFKEGAWRDLWIRWGVDPRSDRQYRFYQRLDIRHKGEPVVPQRKGLTRKPSTVDSGSSNASLHKLLVIQGDHKASDSMLNPVYLIKDIVDPQVREYINRPTVLLDECQKNSGWFHPEALHRVRKVVRGKMSDLQAGREPDVHHYASILDADLPQEKEEAPHEGEEDEYDLPSSPSEGESSRPSASVSASVEPRPTSKDANDRVSSLMKQLQKAQVSVQKDEDDIADMTMDDIEEYDDVFGDDDE
ncbi:hypothetical protein BZG36_03714 [Bifiguratus adelaidae]|uniref:Transcription factor IIIC subunit 5 HTH domain-containing protein n=1 Tax=Bifiguratus adelaidae TaxID=1938954 RepID=A0A261XXG9_9FUNG|nr:hypothetical protein BZG36_03714 [Bifiguratus adelaidae]